VCTCMCTCGHAHLPGSSVTGRSARKSRPCLPEATLNWPLGLPCPVAIRASSILGPIPTRKCVGARVCTHAWYGCVRVRVRVRVSTVLWPKATRTCVGACVCVRVYGMGLCVCVCVRGRVRNLCVYVCVSSMLNISNKKPTSTTNMHPTCAGGALRTGKDFCPDASAHTAHLLHPTCAGGALRAGKDLGPDGGCQLLWVAQACDIKVRFIAAQGLDARGVLHEDAVHLQHVSCNEGHSGVGVCMR